MLSDLISLANELPLTKKFFSNLKAFQMQTQIHILFNAELIYALTM